MNTASSSSDILRRVLDQPQGGIPGLVDDLLAACRDHGIQLDWQSGRYRVRSLGEEWRELGDVPLRKAVFRAILARLAVLCNEHRPGSTSPYGGKGAIAVGTNPLTILHVDFANTPQEQRLALTIGECIMTTEGDPVLAALLEQKSLDKLRARELYDGWTRPHLLPAIAGFHVGATDAQIATARKTLREVLRARADVDRWLGDIADRGIGDNAGPPMGIKLPSEYRDAVELSSRPSQNTTIIIDQARRLGEALKPAAPKPGPSATPRSHTKPGAK
jgi:hypothetical protein